MVPRECNENLKVIQTWFNSERGLESVVAISGSISGDGQVSDPHVRPALRHGKGVLTRAHDYLNQSTPAHATLAVMLRVPIDGLEPHHHLKNYILKTIIKHSSIILIFVSTQVYTCSITCAKEHRKRSPSHIQPCVMWSGHANPLVFPTCTKPPFFLVASSLWFCTHACQQEM
jgi:hypothetical protein